MAGRKQRRKRKNVWEKRKKGQAKKDALRTFWSIKKNYLRQGEVNKTLGTVINKKIK